MYFCFPLQWNTACIRLGNFSSSVKSLLLFKMKEVWNKGQTIKNTWKDIIGFREEKRKKLFRYLINCTIVTKLCVHCSWFIHIKYTNLYVKTKERASKESPSYARGWFKSPRSQKHHQWFGMCMFWKSSECVCSKKFCMWSEKEDRKTKFDGWKWSS